MTFRQRLIRSIYPLMMKITGSFNKDAKVLRNKKNVNPVHPIYNLKVVDNTNKEIQLSEFKNKKILLVNTASDCGYTPQYAELQKLHEQFKDKLVIIGFPANDFKQQEKGNDEEIAKFCKINYGITFPLIKKSTVVKSENQNPIFNWLTDPAKNGWNKHQPDWNFSKYLIDEEGRLTYFFGPAISPLGNEIISAIM
jgi:glutathione peroxidase